MNLLCSDWSKVRNQRQCTFNIRLEMLSRVVLYFPGGFPIKLSKSWCVPHLMRHEAILLYKSESALKTPKSRGFVQYDSITTEKVMAFGFSLWSEVNSKRNLLFLVNTKFWIIPSQVTLYKGCFIYSDSC